MFYCPVYSLVYCFVNGTVLCTALWAYRAGENAAQHHRTVLCTALCTALCTVLCTALCTVLCSVLCTGMDLLAQLVVKAIIRPSIVD
jgi:hypothetical protein